MGKTSTSASRSGEEELPFPGGIVDGEMSVQVLNINVLNKGLQALCRGFGLPSKGNKQQLQERLRAFSSNRDAWHTITPAPRRAHRGPRTEKTTKAKPMKKSALRAQILFGSTSSARVPHLPHQLPTQETPTTSQARSQAILQWAREINASSPFLNKEERLKAGETQFQSAAIARRTANLALPACLNPLALPFGHASYPNLSPSQITPSPASASLIDVVRNLALPNHLVYPFPSHPFAPLPPYVLQSMANRPHDALPPLPSSAPPHSTPNLTTPPSAPSQAIDKPARSITLGNGRVLEFTAADVGPPPAVSFANDIPQLNRMWDDTSEHWGKDSVLNIKGTPIPIKYWKEVYARSKSGVWKHGSWKKVKGQWSEWKYVVRYWRQGSEEDFWHCFSDKSGNRLSYTAIIDRIAILQKEDDKKMAARAREHYGDRFHAVFCYKKGGAIYVKQKDHDIAEQYRRELAKEPGAELDMDIDSD